MIDAHQLRHDIVRPALKLINEIIPWSETAEDLVLGTIAHESKMGRYVRQIRGPALGIVQMEPATHDDIVANFLLNRIDMYRVMASNFGILNSDKLIHDMFYAAVFCRLHYYRVPKPLPKHNVDSIAEYWKEHYNTYMGRGTVEQFVIDYKGLVK